MAGTWLRTILLLALHTISFSATSNDRRAAPFHRALSLAEHQQIETGPTPTTTDAMTEPLPTLIEDTLNDFMSTPESEMPTPPVQTTEATMAVSISSTPMATMESVVVTTPLPSGILASPLFSMSPLASIQPDIIPNPSSDVLPPLFSTAEPDEESSQDYEKPSFEPEEAPMENIIQEPTVSPELMPPEEEQVTSTPETVDIVEEETGGQIKGEGGDNEVRKPKPRKPKRCMCPCTCKNKRGVKGVKGRGKRKRKDKKKRNEKSKGKRRGEGNKKKRRGNGKDKLRRKKEDCQDHDKEKKMESEKPPLSLLPLPELSSSPEHEEKKDNMVAEVSNGPNMEDAVESTMPEASPALAKGDMMGNAMARVGMKKWDYEETEDTTGHGKIMSVINGIGPKPLRAWIKERKRAFGVGPREPRV